MRTQYESKEIGAAVQNTAEPIFVLASKVIMSIISCQARSKVSKYGLSKDLSTRAKNPCSVRVTNHVLLSLNRTLLDMSNKRAFLKAPWEVSMSDLT